MPGGDDHQAVGLVEVAGDLGEELRGRRCRPSRSGRRSPRARRRLSRSATAVTVADVDGRAGRRRARSTNASSSESGSTSGESRAQQRHHPAAGLAVGVEPAGQERRVRAAGACLARSTSPSARRTRRASYDAVATTPRPPTPPTTTGLPRSEGLSRCSTAAKKASRSTWRIDAVGAHAPHHARAPPPDPGRRSPQAGAGPQVGAATPVLDGASRRVRLPGAGHRSDGRRSPTPGPARTSRPLRAAPGPHPDDLLRLRAARCSGFVPERLGRHADRRRPGAPCPRPGRPAARPRTTVDDVVEALLRPARAPPASTAVVVRALRPTTPRVAGEAASAARRGVRRPGHRRARGAARPTTTAGIAVLPRHAPRRPTRASATTCAEHPFTAAGASSTGGWSTPAARRCALAARPRRRRDAAGAVGTRAGSTASSAAPPAAARGLTGIRAEAGGSGSGPPLPRRPARAGRRRRGRLLVARGGPVRDVAWARDRPGPSAPGPRGPVVATLVRRRPRRAAGRPGRAAGLRGLARPATVRWPGARSTGAAQVDPDYRLAALVARAARRARCLPRRGEPLGAAVGGTADPAA